MRLLGTLLILGLFGGAAVALVLYAAVHHTAQPSFCNSCHLMEPYYESWQRSPHHEVACIQCHYEPGALETAEGKFKALSQLAKYVTRTQGTKPWAEVSDQSCMRSGCHSVRNLEGRVQFGRVSFDHKQHLLESQRGRRLRCVTCHGGDPQGQHIAVSKATCFACHFKPGEDGKAPERQSDCLLCHGPPKEKVVVDGREFVHAGYVERGVDCHECHNPVIQGDGAVRKERCHSCHTEIGHIERIGEKAFLHEKHVTEHKVECFECHDEIQHGLLPLQKPGPREERGLRLVPRELARRGAQALLGHGRRRRRGSAQPHVPDARRLRRLPHRPHGLPRTDRAARAGSRGARWRHGRGRRRRGQRRLHPLPRHRLQRPAGPVAVRRARAARAPRAARSGPCEAARDAQERACLRRAAGCAEEHPARRARRLARRAQRRLRARRACARAPRKIDSARTLLGVQGEPPASAGFPFVSKHGCTNCHAGAGRPESIWPAEKRFPHQRHLAQPGFDCDTCHSTSEHGKPSFPRSQCASCHHKEPESGEAPACATCHPAQLALQTGKVASFPDKPGTMSQMECSECHGEIPAVLRPKPTACVLCHKPGYDDMFLAWQKEIGALLASLDAALAKPAANVTPVALESARRAYDAVKKDGTRGAHNFEQAKQLLTEALQSLTVQ